MAKPAAKRRLREKRSEAELMLPAGDYPESGENKEKKKEKSTPFI
jgi:hypothetical protein